MLNKPILITGGTGFLGSALTFALLRDNHDVVIFSRNEQTVLRAFGNQVHAVSNIGQLSDAGNFKAIVNLAGAGIFDRPWSKARKAVLRDSRIQLTENLTDWVSRSKGKPDVFINGSAIGIYGNQADTLLDENSASEPDFSQQLCVDWEMAAMRLESEDIRVCLVRTGLVLGQGGGLLQRMLLPFRWGLGGRLGNGRQWMSWIHIQDWLSMVRAMMADDTMRGPYNATAPHPVTNQDFSVCLAKVLNRPLLLPLPEKLLTFLLGEMSSLVLGSQRVLPRRLLDQGFLFQFPQLEPALRQLLLPDGSSKSC